MELAKAIDGFILDFQASGKSLGTAKLYRLALESLARFLEYPPLESIKADDLKRYFIWLRTEYKPYRPGGDTRPLSESAIDNHWKAIRSFWGWAAGALGSSRPDLSLQRAKFQSPVITPFSESELKALLQACEYSREYRNPKSPKAYRARRPTAARDTALVLFLLDTGLRVSEVSRLDMRYIDLTTGAVTVIPHGSGQKTKPRVVYMGKNARRALWRYLAGRQEAGPGEPLFITQEGGRLGENQIRHLLHYLGERAGVKECLPHRFRHTMAIEFIRNRGDVYSLQRILGHSTLSMCLRYLDLSRDDVAEAFKRASPVDNWKL